MLAETLRSYFGRRRETTEAELYVLYTQHHTDASPVAFFWFLHELKQRGLIQTLDKQRYKLLVHPKPLFIPDITAEISKIAQHLAAHFGLKEYCVWSSGTLNEWSVHQVAHPALLVEVEKDACEAVFNMLRDEGYQNVFLLANKSDERVINRYIVECDHPIVVSRMVSKAPIQTLQNVLVPRIEKILVDLYCGHPLLMPFQSDQYTIFEQALESYAINFKTLFAYSKRRRQERSLQEYLYSNFQEQL